MDSEILLFEQSTTSHNAGRPTKGSAEYTHKAQINKVSQLVNETSCGELGKSSTSEVVLIAHSDKEVSAKIKKPIASEVIKHNTNMFEYALSTLHAWML